MKTLSIAAAVIVLVLSSGLAWAQTPASIVWNLTTDANVSSTTGSITGQAQTLSNLAVQNYTTNNAQRTSPDGAGAWPADAGEVATRYMQFAVAPNGTNSFTVTSISFYLWINSGSNGRATVYYSTDPTFSDRTQIGGTITLSSTAPGSPNVSATPNLVVPSSSTFYLRVYPWQLNSTTGKHLLTKIVTVSGTTSSGSGTITTSDTALSGFSQLIGTPSGLQNYTVSGTGLTNDVSVTPPAGFELSMDAGTNWTSSAITLAQSGGTITGQPVTVSVRLNGPSAAVYSGPITHTSTGANSKNVAVNGTTYPPEPVTQSSLSFSNVTGSSIDVTMSGGDGNGRILVARSAGAVSWAPTDGAAPTGVNSNFSSAADQGSGNKAVYFGSGTAATVTGLASGIQYFFAVYEYNAGTGNSQNYDTAAPGTGNQTTALAPSITVAPASLSFGGVEVNTSSAAQSYTLSGNYLSPSSDVITVTAPASYEVSLASDSGFGASVSVPYTGGTLASTPIYVRLVPTATQTYTGNVANGGGGASTQNVAVTGYGTTPSAGNVLQAEDASLISGYVLTQYAGYTGRGYVDLADKNLAAIEFTFRRATAVSDTVTVYYANGASSRTMTITLNSTSVGTASFTGTGSWSTWSTKKIVVPMVAGINKLRITQTTNGSDPNFDKIFIGGQTATPVYKLTLAASGAGTVMATPAAADSFYDAGTPVTLTASPFGGNFFAHWTGTTQGVANPMIVNMDGNKYEIGVMFPSSLPAPFPYQAAPIGFASVGSFGYGNGTTGGSGANAQTVFITNYQDFAALTLARVDASHVLNFPPLTVYVIGTITGSSMLDVKDVYDMSIIGVGADAKLSGFGLNVVRARNIIIRNLAIENSVIDGITLQADDVEGTGDHVWLDHLTVTHAYDGALDVTHTASYVTLSWNHIYNHDKTCLMGHSDTQSSDVAMKVTYHHNYFDSTVQRHPRVRYGKAHVFNNYYRNNPLYGISSNDGAQVLVEGSYFQNVPLPMDTSRDGSVPGNIVERQNYFTGSGAYQTRGTVFDPTTYYQYALDSASTIPQMVSDFAGSGKYDFSFALASPTYTLNISSPNGNVTRNPLQSFYDSGATVQLTAVPNVGYVFTGWSGDLSGSLNPASIVMTGNKSVTAIFAAQQYTITASAGAGGSISPSGSVGVGAGADQRFTFTPDPGFHVADVLVDGSHVDSLAGYTFRNVQAAHTISVSFLQNVVGKFVLTLTAVHGTVTKNPDLAQYDSGAVVQLTPHASDGYHFVNWTGNVPPGHDLDTPLAVTMDTNKSITANFAANPAVAGSFRSHASGNWSDTTAWERSDGSSWITPAPNVPTSLDGTILVQNGHTITLDVDTTADQVTVDTTGVLKVALGHRLTIADAADSIDLAVYGTLANFGSVVASGRMSVENGATYVHGVPSGGTTMPSPTWRTGSTCRIDSSSGSTPTNLNAQSFYNLVWNATTQTANGGPNFPDGSVINGSLTVLSTNGFQLRLMNMATGGNVKTLTIKGNLNVGGATAIVTTTGSSADTLARANVVIEGNVNVTAGTWSLVNSSAAYAEWKVKGDISITGGSLTSGASGWYARRTLNFAGGKDQAFTIASPGTIGTATTTFKVSNASIVHLNFPFTPANNCALNLESGKIITSSTNTLALPASVTVIGGNSSAYVAGPLTETIASASPTVRFFPIGKDSAYRPVTLTVTQDAATATAYTAEVFNAAPASRTLPAALASVSAVRYYRIAKGSGANLSTSLGATVALSYGADDQAFKASMLRVAKDDGGTNWLNLGGSGSADTTGTITSNAFFSFSDFALATADTTSIAVLPTLTTTPVTYVSTTFATSGGNVTNDGGAAVSARGVCWNLGGAPTIADPKTSDGTGAGVFASAVTGLTPGATYHLRAYATNSAGTAYGDELVFSALAAIVPPTVATTAATSIQVTTAVSGGNVTAWGGDSVTIRGICWNTTGTPTTLDNHTVDGAGLGSFTSGLSPLTGNTTYYVRAYAGNSSGIGYGNQISFTSAIAANDTTVVVAKDGSGNYTTVQAALTAVPAGYTGKWRIFVKKGSYYEKCVLATGKVNVILQGESRDSTIITYDDYADRYGSGNPGTSGSYTLAIDANDFVAKDITIQNTYAPQPGVTGTQAVALRTQGDRHEYINCRLLGFQDTYYTWGGSGTGRMYHRDCLIEGTVDFIFGRNIAVFDNCTIHEKRNGSTLTAGSTDATSQYGYVFRNCTMVFDSVGYDGTPITSVFLGRPWQASPRTVFLNSFEPGSLNPAGWQAWNVTPGLYAEFNCYGAGSGTGGRVAWSSQLAAPTASTYSLTNIFAKNAASSPLILYDWIPSSAISNAPLIERIASSAGAHGTITPSGITNLVYGGSQSFAIAAEPGYHIDSVLVNGLYVGTPSTYQFNNVVGDSAIAVVFAVNAANQYSLTVNALNGTVVKSPDQSAYLDGARVQLTANANPGYHFVDWSGDLTGSKNPDTVTMTGNKSITANFARNVHSVNVTIVGNGTVVKNPDQGSYDEGTVVQLTATPAPGWVFEGWSGEKSGSANPDTVRMTSGRNVTATFTPVIVTLHCGMAAGWNLVSVPLEVSDFSRAALFPTALGEAFSYNGSYVVEGVLRHGAGYWLRFGGAQSVQMDGSAIDPDTVSVVAGWNLIGSIVSPVKAANIASVPSGISTSRFFGYSGTYRPADTLYPGWGYWVKVSQDGQLILAGATGGAIASAAIRIVPTDEMPPLAPGEADARPAIPTAYALGNAYPNPFNPSTTITYQLPADSRVSLKVYNLLGQVVASLVEGTESAGYKQVQWNAGSAASGLYIYRLEASRADNPSSTYTSVKKMVLVK